MSEKKLISNGSDSKYIWNQQIKDNEIEPEITKDLRFSNPVDFCQEEDDEDEKEKDEESSNQ
jgi:hypothetical protein